MHQLRRLLEIDDIRKLGTNLCTAAYTSVSDFVHTVQFVLLCKLFVTERKLLTMTSSSLSYSFIDAISLKLNILTEVITVNHTNE